MVSLENVQPTSASIEPASSPRISFSTDFFDEEDFISIDLNSQKEKQHEKDPERARNKEFEFLSRDFTCQTMISTADELFSQGKLLPFRQMQHSEKLNKISLKMEGVEEKGEGKKEESKVSWFMDDDPSPRPPSCTVLWKELLRLKKQRASSLSSSSSSFSSSSSLSSSGSIRDLAPIDEGEEATGKREKHIKRIKKGLERTRSGSIRIRPVINVPICTQGGKKSVLPPLFPLKKGRLDRS